MIGSHTDPAFQGKLIEKYMALPNKIWDAIIQQASQVSSSYFFAFWKIKCNFTT